MANVILRNEERQSEADFIMDSYGVDRNDPAMREAAEIAAARTCEAMEQGNSRRGYY